MALVPTAVVLRRRRAMGRLPRPREMGQMSETEQDPGEDFGAPDERDAPDGVDPDTGEITEQTPAEAADEEGSEELIKKAERAVATFNKRIDAIFGENAPSLQCPRCDGLGRVWSVEAPARQLKHPPELVACERCDGYGEVETGSKNPQHETTICTSCNATGWKVAVTQPENVTPIAQAQVNPPAQTMGFMGADGVFVPLGQPQGAQTFGGG